MPLNLAALRSLLLGCRADGGLARPIPLTERVVPARRPDFKVEARSPHARRNLRTRWLSRPCDASAKISAVGRLSRFKCRKSWSRVSAVPVVCGAAGDPRCRVRRAVQRDMPMENSKQKVRGTDYSIPEQLSALHQTSWDLRILEIGSCDRSRRDSCPHCLGFDPAIESQSKALHLVHSLRP
jgi:hypothetical protein